MASFGGFNFGNPGSTNTATSVTSTAPFSFGGQTTTAAPTAANTGFAFGAPAASTATTAATGLTFGAATTTSQASAATPFSFGAFSSTPSTTTAAPLGFSSAFGASTTAPSTTAAASATKGLGGTFGAGTLPTPSAGSIFGGTSNLTSGSVAAKGGTALTTGNAPQSTNTPGKNPKDTPLEKEVSQTVNNFKTFLADQKKIREELSKFSEHPVQRVTEEWRTLTQQAQQVKQSLRSLNAQIRLLKQCAMKTEKHIAIAQRTQETPLGLQYENTAPNEYFQEMVRQMESKLVVFSQEIEALESRIIYKDAAKLDPKGLLRMMQNVNEQFLAAASNLYSIHEQIQELKLIYTQMRNSQGFHGDPFAEVMERIRKNRQLQQLHQTQITSQSSLSTQSHVGPNPFSQDSLMMKQWPYPGVKSPNPLAATGTATSVSKPAGTGFGFSAPGTQASAGSGFGVASGGLFSSGVQLQDPPVGKRKR